MATLNQQGSYPAHQEKLSAMRRLWFLSRQHWVLAPLTAILLLGAWMRWETRMAYHGGDMDVILSITYHMLSWPPIEYYHLYRPQTWVYNHLPVLPGMAAPSYWLFENVMNLPREWSVKLVTGSADLLIGILLYRQARVRWRQWWGLGLAGLWVLVPWVVDADDHGIALAIAFALAAFASLENGWLCGVLLGLGVGTRTEIAFFALPVVLYFLRRRPPQWFAFFTTFGVTIALLAGPLLLYDAEALDYAMRRQLQRDAASQVSLLFQTLSPYLQRDAASFLQQNPSVLALGLNLLVGLLALRDRRLLRVEVVASLGYLMTLPVVHERYTLFAYGVGLLYAARYANPWVASLILAMTLPEFPYVHQVWVLMFLGMALWGLIRPEEQTKAAEPVSTLAAPSAG